MLRKTYFLVNIFLFIYFFHSDLSLDLSILAKFFLLHFSTTENVLLYKIVNAAIEKRFYEKGIVHC